MGYYSYRNKVWQKTARGGIMPIAFEKLTFEKYFDHVIDISNSFCDKRQISISTQMDNLLKILF